MATWGDEVGISKFRRMRETQQLPVLLKRWNFLRISVDPFYQESLCYMKLNAINHLILEEEILCVFLNVGMSKLD
jgi:hypothetical protein